MKEILVHILLIFIAFLITILVPDFLERTTIVNTGNVCDVTNENPNGDCYLNVKSLGFPFKAGVILPKFSATNSEVELIDKNYYIYGFIGNILFYYLLLFLIMIFLQKNRKKFSKKSC